MTIAEKVSAIIKNTDLPPTPQKPKTIYTFASSPRALYTNRKLYISDGTPYANLMHEKRIYRGSNFAPKTSTCTELLAAKPESAVGRAVETRRRAMARRRARAQCLRAAQLRITSPPPVAGRKHEPVQTDQYLEELFANPPTTEICTQTDLFLERPVSPYYVPAKIGRDVETQIWPGDLFDFDMEVQPILEILVGKTIEQSLIEVLEEEELAALREQQRRFLELRASESAKVQRLDERERRLQHEKTVRIEEHTSAMKVHQEMEERIAAAVLLQGYIADLLPSVLDDLESEQVLMDQIKKEIDEDFMPWLMREVTQEMQEIVGSRDVLCDIIREILERRAEIYRELNKTPRSPVCSEEECPAAGPTLDEIILQEHFDLQKEIATAQLKDEDDDVL